jgi:hypothetical protein
MQFSRCAAAQQERYNISLVCSHAISRKRAVAVNDVVDGC